MHATQHPEHKAKIDNDNQQYQIKKENESKNKLNSVVQPKSIFGNPTTMKDNFTIYIHDVINKLDILSEKKEDFIKFHDIFDATREKYSSSPYYIYNRVSRPYSSIVCAIDIAKVLSFEAALKYIKNQNIITKELLSDIDLFSEEDSVFLVVFWEKYLKD
jgi:hypothetical protein